MILQSMLQRCFYLNASLNHWKQVKAPQSNNIFLLFLVTEDARQIHITTYINSAPRRSAHFYSSYYLSPFQRFSQSSLTTSPKLLLTLPSSSVIADKQHPPKLQALQKGPKGTHVSQATQPTSNLFFYESFLKHQGWGIQEKKHHHTQEEGNSWKLCCLYGSAMMNIKQRKAGKQNKSVPQASSRSEDYKLKGTFKTTCQSVGQIIAWMLTTFTKNELMWRLGSTNPVINEHKHSAARKISALEQRLLTPLCLLNFSKCWTGRLWAKEEKNIFWQRCNYALWSINHKIPAQKAGFYRIINLDGFLCLQGQKYQHSFFFFFFFFIKSRWMHTNWIQNS